MTIGILVVGFSPKAFNAIVLDACVPVIIAALIYAFAASVEIFDAGITCISLVGVTPVTDTVYVYGAFDPDQLLDANIMLTDLYLLDFEPKLLFRD